MKDEMPIARFHWLARYLEQNPHASLEVTVKRHSHHYVHERSTTVEVDAVNFGPDDYRAESRPEDDRAVTISEELQEYLKEWVVDKNQEIYKNLESEHDYLTSDEEVINGLDANEHYFDPESGDELDKEEGGVYASDLEPALQSRVADKHRDQNTDHEWYEYVIEDATNDLDSAGFQHVKIDFSGFCCQGDGASFTASGFSLPTFLVYLEKPAPQAESLVKELLQ
jgi:hypothetical protein